MGVKASVRVQELSGYNAGHGSTVVLVEPKNGSARSWVVDKSVCQHRMIDRLPKVHLGSWGHPIAVESPHIHECVTLPSEFVLMPGLCRVGSRRVRARF